jgi:hypothetical protein
MADIPTNAKKAVPAGGINIMTIAGSRGRNMSEIVEEWIERIAPPIIFGTITWFVWQHAFIRMVWPEGR